MTVTVNGDAAADAGAAARDSSTSTTTTAKTVTVDETSEGKTVDVAKGQSIVLMLNASPTSGFDWAVKKAPAALGTPTMGFVSGGDQMGASGKRRIVWTVKDALPAGEHAVELGYARSFEPGVAPFKTFRFKGPRGPLETSRSAQPGTLRPHENAEKVRGAAAHGGLLGRAHAHDPAPPSLPRFACCQWGNRRCFARCVRRRGRDHRDRVERRLFGAATSSGRSHRRLERASQPSESTPLPPSRRCRSRARPMDCPSSNASRMTSWRPCSSVARAAVTRRMPVSPTPT